MAVALKDMPLRVLVTGAGGFVGRHLLTALDKTLASGSEIIAGFATGNGGVPEIWGGTDIRIPVRGVEMDITDRAQVNGVLKAEQPTHVVHLAAIAAVTAATRDPRLTW